MIVTEQEFNLYFKQKNYDYIEDFRVDNAVILAAGFASRFAPCPIPRRKRFFRSAEKY